ncbi:serine hydrolase domain-containing protein [Ruania zhangjianzhongii]|uniref:serine hydrolase domain-containing protein n=1 Tax=Ruania zhangjianzhongii TaxID=2603206 RepID=UPI0011C9BB23|nr:serine hydrolase domain-containing protein [Ruania zhangjianzhongii]
MSQTDVSAVLRSSDSAETVGIPSSAILALLRRMERRGLNAHSLLIARHGAIAFEAYWHPYSPETPHRLYSASKSLVSLAIGTLVDDGRLSLEDRIIDHFPDKLPSGDLDPYLTAMRVVDLLTMRTAHGSTTFKQVADTDWVRTFFTVPPNRQPGMVFSYDTSGSVVLTALVERLSGKPLTEYLTDRVLTRIGVQDPWFSLVSPTGMDLAERGGQPTWREVESNPEGTSHGGSGVFCTPRDLLRVAQLCLAQGRWGSDQVISAEFLRAATDYQVSTALTSPAFPDGRCGYGYQFWRNRGGGYSMRGMGGQIALCLPEEDVVIVTTGDNQGVGGADQAFFDAVAEELVPALGAPRAVDPDSAAELARYARSLALAPVPVTGSRAGGRFRAEYELDPGPTAFVGLELDVSPDFGVLRLHTADGQQREFRFGLGSLVRHGLPGYGYETHSSGAWLDENTLHVHSHVLGRYLAQIDLMVTAGGEAVTLVMNRAAEAFAEEYEGTVSGRRR